MMYNSRGHKMKDVVMFDTTQIQKVLDKVQVYLGWWLNVYLRRVYKTNFWSSAVLNALTQEQRANLDEEGAQSLEELDFATIISVFLGNFKILRREVHLDSELFDMAKHVKRIRNLYAHKNTKSIAEPDIKKAKYHIDTLHHFMEGLGADSSLLREIDEVYNLITRRMALPMSSSCQSKTISNGVKINVSSLPDSTNLSPSEVEKLEVRTGEQKDIKKIIAMSELDGKEIISPKSGDESFGVEHCLRTRAECCTQQINFGRPMYEDVFPCEALIIDGKHKTEAKVQGRGNWNYIVIMPFTCSPAKALELVTQIWACPDSNPYVENGHIVWEFPCCNEPLQSNGNPLPLVYLTGTLPSRIEDWIIKHTGNNECGPNSRRVGNNLNANAQDANWYLKNYFPRSFVETFCIYDHFLPKCLNNVRAGKDTLTICDIGIGSGGATYGLIWALRKRLYGDKTFKKIKVYGLDGNLESIRLFEMMKPIMIEEWPIEYEYVCKQVMFNSSCIIETDTAMRNVDFVITSKCLQEIPYKGDISTGQIYRVYFEFAQKVVSKNGLISIMEIDNLDRFEVLSNVVNSIGDSYSILTQCVNGTRGICSGSAEIYSTQRENHVLKEAIMFTVLQSNSERIKK